MLRFLMVGVVVLPFAAGCTDPCQRLINDDKEIPSKACVWPDAGETSSTLVQFANSITTTTQCETALKSCSAQDVQQIDDYLTCIEAAPVCDVNDQNAPGSALTNCEAGHLSYLSESCDTAFGNSYSGNYDGGIGGS
jgi:hypothetical protein